MKTSKIYGFHYPPSESRDSILPEFPKYFWDSSGLCLPGLTHTSHPAGCTAYPWLTLAAALPVVADVKGQVGGKMRHIDCSTGGIMVVVMMGGLGDAGRWLSPL